MKNQFLKIAGVKTESAFYKKYKTEKEFFSAHPEAKKLIKKAQTGFTEGFGLNSDGYDYGYDTREELTPLSNILKPQGIKPLSNITSKPVSANLPNLKSSSPEGFDYSGMIAGGIQAIPNIINAFQSEKKQKQALEQQNKLLGLTDTLAKSTDVNAPYTKHINDRPENYIQSTNSFYPSKGTGYDILRAARDGSYIPKAQDGINNFGPMYDIYSDGGYEPYGSVDNIKTYQEGGDLSSLAGPASNIGNELIGAGFNNNAGYQAAQPLGQFSDFVAPGSSAFVKPILGAIGGGLDQAFGNAGKINTLNKKNKNLEDSIMNNSMWKNLNQFGNVRQEGGYVSNDWTPQVIAKFGDHTAKDYYDYSQEGMESLRSGGHLKDDKYMPVSNRGLQTYQSGGELKTHWGGEVEPVSYNPYSEGQGLTYNAYGNSHFEKDHQGRTGIGLSVLQNGGNPNEPDVEIEKQEPISMTNDGAVVYGNLNTNKDLLKDFELPEEYANQKVKNIVNKLIVPKEQKYNKELQKITSNVPNSNSKFTALTDKTKEVQTLGLNMKLKQLAKDKENLAAYQDHIHQTTDFLTNLLGKEVSQEKFAKNGEVSHVLAKGELSKNVAQSGKKIKFKSEEEAIKAGYTKDNEGIWKKKSSTSGTSKEVKKAEAQKEIPLQHSKETGFYGDVTPEKFEEFKKANDWYNWTGFNPKNKEQVKDFQEQFNKKAKEYGSDAYIEPDSLFGNQTYSARLNTNKNTTPASNDENIAEIEQDYTPIEQTPKKGFPWEAAATSLIRGLYPTFNMPLGDQINPELYAMANNNVEGLAEPHMYSMMQTPYKYSADADRNAILSQARAAVKNSENNAAAQSAIMSQVAQAMDQIGSKELNVNQQTEQGVYNNNINTHNQDLARNLGIDMDAANKLSEAKSKTKATTEAALASIYAKKALNRKDNMDYNMGMALHPDYTFGPDGRVIKLPRYIDFDTSGKMASNSNKQVASEGFEFLYDSKGKVKSMKPKKEDDTSIGQEGKTIKKKNINGNIVKAFKNL